MFRFHFLEANMHHHYSPTRRFAVKLQVCFLASLLLAACSASAQIAGTGNIQGTVVDASGALIPNATVTLTDASTHVTRITATDQAGVYLFPNIRISTYNLK